MSQPPALVDSHCHLPLLGAERDTAQYLADAAAAGVGHVLCVGVDLETFPGVLALAQRFPNVWASVGIHPNGETEVRDTSVEELCAIARDPRVVAIGETGLDYYHQQGDPSLQHARFRLQIQAARAAGKPLVIHTRDAAADTLRLMREEGADTVGGVMHCFVEDWPTAAAAMELGFYISFSGIVTFKNASALQAVARQVPLDRLLVETDAPWLAPMPRRGKPNEPAYVRHTAEFLARLRDEDYATLAAATTRNFFTLFRDAR
ncbi:MAG: TatD family hydrolase [Gammaproteobacteria bacterium]